MTPVLLNQLVRLRTEKRAVVLVTDLGSFEQRLLDPFQPGSDAPAELVRAARQAAERDRSAVVEVAGRELMLRVFNPSLRLIVIGAVHIAQSLVRLAQLNAWDVVVIDPRRAFATEARFPGVRLVHGFPEAALAELDIDRRCAVVALSHDPKLDEPALAAALRAEAFYVGALGSRRTHEKRLQRLRELGLPEPLLARIHGPVGLSIGALTAAEIATSIMAEAIAELRQPRA